MATDLPCKCLREKIIHTVYPFARAVKPQMASFGKRGSHLRRKVESPGTTLPRVQLRIYLIRLAGAR